MSPKLLAALSASHKKDANKAVKKDGVAVKSTRSLKAQNTMDEAKEQATKQLPQVTDTQLTLVVKGNTTMLAEIACEKRAARERGGRMSCAFWKALKEKWGINDVCSSLPVTAEIKHMSISPALVSALRSAQDKNRSKKSKEQFIAWCLQTPSCNLRELNGLIRQMAEIRPNSKSAKKLWVACMKLAVRLDWVSSKAHEEPLSI